MEPAALRDLLISWANLNSGSDNIAGLDRMRHALAAGFATLRDATIEHVPLTGSPAKILRITTRPQAPAQLLLSGHYDTVYGADSPFQTCTLLDERTLRGPGVADMKGGLVVMLAALREFEDSPHAARLGFDILLTPDEETGSVASRPVLEAAARSRRHAFALVFEPARANGDLVKSRKGTGIFTVTVHGRAAHAGRDPGAGRNAILALAALLPRLDALGDKGWAGTSPCPHPSHSSHLSHPSHAGTGTCPPTSDALPGVMLNIGTIRGGGTVNIVPALASADVNVRITRPGDAAAFLARLDALLAEVSACDGYRAARTGQFNRGPKVESPFEERLFAAWQQCARELGTEVSWQHVGGGSDGNLLSAAGLANLDGLGPVGDHLHSPDEFVHLPSLPQRAHIAARFFHRLAAGEVSLAPASP